MGAVKERSVCGNDDTEGGSMRQHVGWPGKEMESEREVDGSPENYLR